jgi:hypothetical protein
MVRTSPARIFCLFALLAFPVLVAAQQPTSTDQAIPLPDAESGKDYTYKPGMQGGTPPFQWSLSGKLPADLKWSATDGSISGNLQGAAPGKYIFELTISDSSNPQMKASQQFTLTVKPAPLKIVAGPGQLKIIPAVTPAAGPAEAAPQTPDPPSAKPPADDGSTGVTDANKKGVSGGKSGAAKSTSPLKLDPDTVPAGTTGDVKITVSGPTDNSAEFFLNCSTTRISSKSNTKPHSAWNDGATNFTIVLDASAVKEAGTILISTTPDCSKTDPTSLAVLNVSAFNEMAPLEEAMVGVDVSAASSANPQAVFLGVGLIDIPVSLTAASRNITHSKFGAVWVSGQLGLKGMAQPGAVSGALSSGYFATAVNATPDKIVQSVDMSLHIGLELHQWRIPIASFDVPNSKNTATHESKPTTIAMLSLIGGGGAITPLSLSQANPQIFEATPQIISTFNGMKNGDGTTITFPTSCTPTTCFVTFTPADRSRFYRYYDGGLRLKLYSRDYPDGELRFPAILDLTIGQSEYVTGGIAHGPVLHVGGSFPIPRADSFYGFGSMDLGLTRASGGGAQLFFVPVPMSVQPPPTPTSTSVTNIITAQPNRDRYVFGFGVDLIHLLTPKKSAAAPSC